MKCPYCKKEIECKEKPKDKFTQYMELLPMNGILYVALFAFIFTQLNDYLNIPWNTQHGANANYDILLMFIPIIFLLIYVGLYVYKKVKGRLLIFK
jgi:hypothetical protein